MAHEYRLVQWTPFKRSYDLVAALAIGLYLATFVLVTFLVTPNGANFTEVQVLIRAFGSAAYLLLTFILAIGPLARLSPRFKPLLYNRRHLGVATFLLALVHAALVTVWYHGFGELNPLVSLLVSNPRYDSIGGFPFESLGLIALVVLFVMAATSHDFFNANLGPVVWKTLHMGVYLAYALLVAHVLLGVVQYEKNALYPILAASGAATLIVLHLATGLREVARDRRAAAADRDGWLRVAPVGDLIDTRAKIVLAPGGERIAVFRNGNRISAVSNVCRHQGGPLGEGRIVDGCITCPWHGFQYRPEDGCSPPPFTEKIATYRTRIVDGIVYVHSEALPPGMPTPPAEIST